VPANFAHGVKTNPDVDDVLEILAFGVPHMPLDSTNRMRLVNNPSARNARPGRERRGPIARKNAEAANGGTSSGDPRSC
jgi:hypothetical protein